MLDTRVLSASLAAVVLTGAALIIAAPATAAESLTITAPAASSTVSGELRIEGRLGGEGMTDLSLSLAPQSLGECGAPVATTESEVPVGVDFAALIDTTRVANGVYCIIAVAERGSLSDVQGDILVANDFVSGGDFQLPTLVLPEDGEVAQGANPAVPLEVGPVLALFVFGLAGIAAAAAGIVGFRYGRRPSRR